MLAAAQETQLLSSLLVALPRDDTAISHRLAQMNAPSRQMSLLTLLFLGVVGLERTWDLRAYSGDGLALLTGRRRAYGYRHTERFLADLARAGADTALSTTLARWTASLWRTSSGTDQPVFYVDGHRKPVYSDVLLPRGLIGRRGAILGCRALVLLHDAAGHPLLVLTYRGDQHLTLGLPAVLEAYERSTDQGVVGKVVVDREGMAAEFLARLVQEGRTVISILRADQYHGLDSFTDVSAFAALERDQAGQIVREVASARFALAVPGTKDASLPLYVALIRDQRRQVPVHATTQDGPRRWDADLSWEEKRWWETDWVATAAPAPPREPKLIPIVSTSPMTNPAALVQIYTQRWPAQENSIKDFLIPLGLDVNHGYAKTAVVNSEVTKRRTALEKRLQTLEQWAIKARQRCDRAGVLYRRRQDKRNMVGRELYRVLNRKLQELEQHGVSEGAYRKASRELAAVADEEIRQLDRLAERAFRQSNAEDQKCERYRQTQRRLLRELEDLNQAERQMYVLDNRKDQLMTVLKVALVNLVMWARDQFFPAGYRHATWQRLVPFFRLPGRVLRNPTMIRVELRPFNDRALTRDLIAFCARVNEAQPKLPDGRVLELGVAQPRTRHAPAVDR